MPDAAYLTLVTTIKLLAEIALLALAGQGVIGLLSGAARERNPFYRVLELVGRPWVRVARKLSPRVVMDRHLPLVVFLLLLMLWAAAAIAKIRICLHIGVALCQATA
ncbi:hypothetical protein [Polaromonas eurypsychrophila]|uniref:YggT family protein n=1 Tax=Polaromonas eurypsychrophila TaxID=1614635 RepID=A0A916WL78_9BURK|nr:hypothetical protein [Polaromonas eurypsychrophila]GGB08317.1 hypothetical protein GCM10011496_31530 [Polaromonas eurypsychrophila]